MCIHPHRCTLHTHTHTHAHSNLSMHAHWHTQHLSNVCILTHKVTHTHTHTHTSTLLKQRHFIKLHCLPWDVSYLARYCASLITPFWSHPQGQEMLGTLGRWCMLPFSRGEKVREVPLSCPPMDMTEGPQTSNLGCHQLSVTRTIHPETRYGLPFEWTKPGRNKEGFKCNTMIQIQITNTIWKKKAACPTGE